MRHGMSKVVRSRTLRVLLAAWMMVFAVAEVVHTHGTLGAKVDQASLTQPVAGTPQNGACLACLAQQNPVPAAHLPVVCLAPETTEAAAVPQLATCPEAAAIETSSSRGPPTHSTIPA